MRRPEQEAKEQTEEEGGCPDPAPVTEGNPLAPTWSRTREQSQWHRSCQSPREAQGWSSTGPCQAPCPQGTHSQNGKGRGSRQQRGGPYVRKGMT